MTDKIRELVPLILHRLSEPRCLSDCHFDLNLCSRLSFPAGSNRDLNLCSRLNFRETVTVTSTFVPGSVSLQAVTVTSTFVPGSISVQAVTVTSAFVPTTLRQCPGYSGYHYILQLSLYKKYRRKTQFHSHRTVWIGGRRVGAMKRGGSGGGSTVHPRPIQAFTALLSVSVLRMTGEGGWGWGGGAG